MRRRPPTLVPPSASGADARVARAATVAAIVITMVAAAAMSTGIGPRIVGRALAPARERAPDAERVRFATSAPTPVPPATRLRRVAAPARGRTPPAATARDTGGAITAAAAAAAAAAAGPASAAAPGASAGASPESGPVVPGMGTVLRVPTPLPSTRTRAAVVRDSVAFAIGGAVPALARARRPTGAESDSIAHTKTQELILRRDAHRPPPVPMGGIGGPLSAHVRERRMRDSITNARNLARLRAIRERADSARAATASPPSVP